MQKENTHHGNPEDMAPATIRIDFNDLISGEIKEDVYEGVEKAFGFDGLGAIIVTNAPDFRETKEKVQRNMYRLSQEPKELLQAITKTDASGAHEIGWSERKAHSPFGKSTNKLVTFNRAFRSGNPHKTAIFQDPRFGKEGESVWPATIPRFKQDLSELHSLFISPVLGLLKYFDKYLSHKIRDDKQRKFVDSFLNHYACDHRLLMYFPLDGFETGAEDRYIWENWHIDHGLMTTLSHPIYFTRQGEMCDLDNTALALKDRYGREHQAVFSQDEFMIITASAMFIESAGYIPGTPHTVKISEGMPMDLYRIQAVSFFEPDWNHRMTIPTGESFQEIVERDPCKYEYRDTEFYRDGCYFKEFHEEIAKSVYNVK
uniref:Isopenicillin N synthase n=1 Tax=Candidatus Kentrum sp. MB TaxID=2138164 RepID=A0A450X845_9GAMM|nr:MAG: hypothetical protein BECKMB1821G_GA0114241_101357 [Candidatus Kentron sp. MB]VFK29067.1 MAG: hypothetical protein BECKMB1821I_GA0114274_100818 [Candidatus Kentron sp. MB]VFK74659.1 MAG: hypothetical protein BECKMB1821H_GA0114242_100818 [Candidatus Kentron sp. MB]